MIQLFFIICYIQTLFLLRAA